MKTDDEIEREKRIGKALQEVSLAPAMPNTERDAARDKAFEDARTYERAYYNPATDGRNDRYYFNEGIAQRDRELAGGVEIDWRPATRGWDGYILPHARYIGHITPDFAVEHGVMYRTVKFDSLDSAKAEAAKQVNELRKLLNGG